MALCAFTGVPRQTSKGPFPPTPSSPNLFTQRGVSSKEPNPGWQREPLGSGGSWEASGGGVGASSTSLKLLISASCGGFGGTSSPAAALFLAGLDGVPRG